MVLPELPERFTARAATMADVEATTELVNACSMADLGRATVEAAGIRNDWGSPYLNPQTNIHLVFDGDRLVGYAGAWIEPPAVSVYASGRVHPEAKALGIGTYLGAWLEALVRESALKLAPEHARVVLHQEKLSTDIDSHALLESLGYSPVRHGFRMLIELESEPPKPVFPEGIEMRSFNRPTQLRALVQAEKDIFRDHWGYVELDFEQDLQAWEHWLDNDPHFDPAIWYLALNGEGIAGVCLCNSHMPEDPELAYVGSLGVQRAWRRQGLGLAMLHHAFGVLYRQGKKRVSLDVDAQSLTGASRLYERAGMHIQREGITYELVVREGVDLSTQALES
ncbi:MAG: GNAT family N-acetyltransferase [Anaerolineae bacterium]|nr:GNAT family N-acetyltransferase [Anaerolineae bacterium]